MDINSILQDQVMTGIIVTAVVLTLADFVLGVAGSVRLHAFTTAQVAQFVQTHVVGRVLPIGTVAVLGHFEPALAALAATAAAAYTLETLGSIRESFSIPPAQTIASGGAIPDPAIVATDTPLALAPVGDQPTT